MRNARPDLTLHIALGSRALKKKGASMKRIVFSLVLLLTITFTLNASSPVKGLGGGFSQLIADNQVDSKYYPDRLLQLKNRMVKLNTTSGFSDTYGLDIIPFTGSFVSRHELIGNASEENYLFVNDYQEGANEIIRKKISLNNLCAFKVSSIPLGFGLNISSDQMKQNNPVTNYYDSDNHSEMKIAQDNKTTSYKFTVSSRLGSDSSTSVSFNYTEYKGIVDLNVNDTDYYSNETYLETSSYIATTDGDIYRKYYNLGAISDFGESKQYRVMGEFIYQSHSYNELKQSRLISSDTDYESTIEKDTKKVYEEIVESDWYSAKVGLSKTISLKNMKFYLALKVGGSYSSEKNEQKETSRYQLIENDSLVIITNSYNDDLEKERYTASLYTPIGMSWQVTDWLTFYTSITSSIVYSSMTGDDINGYDMKGWRNKTSQQISLEFTPLDNLEIGLYKISDFERYKNWALELSYLF